MTVEEYNLCVDRYADNVYRFFISALHDRELSKDMVQEVFLRLWNKHKDISFEAAKSYIFKTAYHLTVDLFRKKTTLSIAPEEIATYDIRTTTIREHFDMTKILDEGLKKLPDVQRTVLLLRDYEGYSYKEIEQITGLSETQVKVYIYRARVFLKNFLFHYSIIL